MENTSLKTLIKAIEESNHPAIDTPYLIPKLWVIPEINVRFDTSDTQSLFRSPEKHEWVVRPREYFTTVLKWIQEHSKKNTSSPKYLENKDPGDWLLNKNVYGLFIRLFTAYNHCGQSHLGGSEKDITLNPYGVRETGTFLKTIALLPYLYDLGIDVLYLLPISESGIAYRKGELGSPYAVRDPYKIAIELADPFVELDAADQFKLLVAACHQLGIKVLLDFVPRTCSRDSDWVADHPHWFYWINEEDIPNYHMPFFSGEELRLIFEQYHDKSNNQYLPPSQDYIHMFQPPPTKENVWKDKESQAYLGKIDERTVVIPGAFADWPPDDIQPPWDDVTYLKLYLDSDFNYIAYNTIRMYDERITQKNESLWRQVSQIIPFYIKQFGIDGARIDMGHALPKPLETMIIEDARENSPQFALISENFDSFADVKKSGYNVVWGNSWWECHRLCYQEWENEEEKTLNRYKNFILNTRQFPSTVIGSIDTSDTPRTAARENGIPFARLAITINSFLADTVLFIQSGFEWHEKIPSNLGLDFSREEIDQYKEKLALFGRARLQWQLKEDPGFYPFVKQLLALRKKYADIIFRPAVDSFCPLTIAGVDTADPYDVSPGFGFLRYSADQSHFLMVICNFDHTQKQDLTILPPDWISSQYQRAFINILNQQKVAMENNNQIKMKLDPFQVIVLTKD